jgi:diadenylate cyclase
MFRLQREELSAGVEDTLRLVVRDYVADGSPRGVRSDGRNAKRAASVDERDRKVARALAALHDLVPEELLNPTKIAETMGQAGLPEDLDAGLECRGYRLLHRVPRVSDAIIDRIVERFETLPGIMQASLGDLEKVGGVGAAKARSVKEGLSRMAEASILERYE